MNKIESRPVQGKAWEYRFFVDFDGNLEDAAVKNAIRGLREEARNLRILGNYSIDGQIWEKEPADQNTILSTETQKKDGSWKRGYKNADKWTDAV